MILDQGPQAHVNQLGLFLFACIALCLSEQLVINVDGRPQAYIDAQFICITQGYPSLTKYFPGSCLTKRFSSNCNKVDETAALDSFVFWVMSSIDVSTASIAS